MTVDMCQILSMRGGNVVGALTRLIMDIQNLSFEGEASKDENNLHFWDNWSNDGNEGQGMKLIAEDIRAAMQFLQVKVLRTMSIHVPDAIHNPYHHPEALEVKPGQNAPL